MSLHISTLFGEVLSLNVGKHNQFPYLVLNCYKEESENFECEFIPVWKENEAFVKPY